MTLKSSFLSHFGTEPMAYGRAFGRANLIGDHTDYNDGFVLPCLLNHHTDVALRLNDSGRITGHSDHFAPESSAIDSQSDGSWLDFVRGAIAMVAETGIETKGLDVCVRSNVPAGAGVSSSAALEIALIRGLLAAHEAAPMDAGIMARYAQRIEHEFVGTQCGIMDQMVSAAASLGQAMLLDCRSLDSALHALFDTADFLVLHSGSSRKLSKGAYNDRLADCQQAAAELGVSSLRDAAAEDVIRIETPRLAARARHVISENMRVLAAIDALKTGDAAAFGALMNDSHESLAGDYEVSSPELDRLVEAARQAGAYGARLTGAGFGGCVVVLAEKSKVDGLLAAVSSACPDSWLVDRISAAD